MGHEHCFGGAKLQDSFGSRVIRVSRKMGHGGFQHEEEDWDPMLRQLGELESYA